jgi:FHS family Na+ dependent glucose MFS transporter 1
MEKKRQIALYYSISSFVGMATAILGPSILYLVDQTHSSLTELSFIFPARAGSYLFGSWISGILFDRYRGHRLLVVGLVVMGITLAAVPFLLSSVGLVSLIIGMGVAMGLVDVGCNTLLFRVRDIKIAPVMNGLHFFYGLGSFLAPLILAGSLKLQNSIRWGYWGFGFFSLFVLVQLIRLPEPIFSKSESIKNDHITQENANHKSILILMIAIFYFAFVGVEIGYGDWLYTYSLKSSLMDDQGAVLLTSVYWGAFTVARLISIPLAARYKSRRILLGDLAGAFIGLGLVLFFPGSRNALWLGTIVLGASLASIFPTALTYVETLMPMTGKITSRFFVSGSIGSIFLPWIIGRYVEGVGPQIIIYVLSATLVIAGVMFFMFSWYSRRSPKASTS